MATPRTNETRNMKRDTDDQGEAKASEPPYRTRKIWPPKCARTPLKVQQRTTAGSNFQKNRGKRTNKTGTSDVTKVQGDQ
jgi:hypothetical protein